MRDCRGSRERSPKACVWPGQGGGQEGMKGTRKNKESLAGLWGFKGAKPPCEKILKLDRRCGVDWREDRK